MVSRSFGLNPVSNLTTKLDESNLSIKVDFKNNVSKDFLASPIEYD